MESDNGNNPSSLKSKEHASIETSLGATRRTVTIYVMGKGYRVPEGLTILKALEYIGYKLIRGVGCRAGFCGACTTLWVKKGDYKLYSGLACQTVVEDGMYLVQIPFVPAEKRKYDINELDPTVSSVLALYPEIARCIGCNACTKVCPQNIQVMDAIQEILRGNIAKAARMVFDCISCGACSLRCPAEIKHFHVFQLVRRLYGKYLAPKAKHLELRVKEIADGKYEEPLSKLIEEGPERWRELAEKLQRGESLEED